MLNKLFLQGKNESFTMQLYPFLKSEATIYFECIWQYLQTTQKSNYLS